MAKVTVPFRLDPEQLAKLNGHAEKRSVSRQALIEAAVDLWLNAADAANAPAMPARIHGITTAAALARRPIDPDTQARQARMNAAKTRKAAGG